MPLTQLDPVAALVVIDLQKGIASNQSVQPISEVIDRSAQLAHAFRSRGLPVVLVNVARIAVGRTDFKRPRTEPPPDFAELVPELGRQQADYTITKQAPGAFIGTELHQVLRERDVTQIFLTGVATSLGVESTARSAYDYGYNVVFVADAMKDLSEDSHRHCIYTIFPRLGEVTTTAQALAFLSQPKAQ